MEIKEKGPENTKFVETVLHELRVPVSSINGYASLFLTGELGRVPKSQLTIIRKIRDLALYASDLINNVISLACLNIRKAVHCEKFVLSDILERVTLTLSGQIRQRKIKLHFDLDKKTSSLWGFSTDIEHIVSNILSNAVKFTPKNGHIYVKSRRKGTRFILSVTDTGIGIPSKAIPNVFNDFYRADNVVREYDGSGLGLSIVKKLLERSKGDISVKSKVNQGSSFEISLPILAEKEVFDYELEQAVSESSRSGKSFAVLTACSGEFLKKKKQQSLLELMKMNKIARKGDSGYWIEGDKYAMILPEVDFAEIRLIAERFKAVLREKFFRKKAMRPGSISVGFVIFPADGGNKNELLSALEKNIKNPDSRL